MKVFRNILVRFIIMGLALVAFHFIYKAFSLESDIQEYSDIINLLREVQDSSDILYFGESSNNTTHKSDSDKRMISEMAGSYYPGLRFNSVTHGALHAGIFKVLLQNIPESSQIQTVIITMNLRSFNADWIYSELESSLMRKIVLLRQRPALLNRFLLSFKGYDIKDQKEREIQVNNMWEDHPFDLPFDFQFKDVREWDKYIWHHGIVKSDGTRDLSLKAIGCHYIKGYAFQIDTSTNPRIKDFDEIVNIANERGWNLVFNLLAENTEKANKLLSDTLVWFMHSNRDLLVKRYSDKGVFVVDNLEEVEDKDFIDQDWTTEHYTEAGRNTIARNLADTLKQIHNKFYSAE